MAHVLRILLALMMVSPGCLCAIAVELDEHNHYDACSGHTHPCDTGSEDCPEEPAPCDHSDADDLVPASGGVASPAPPVIFLPEFLLASSAEPDSCLRLYDRNGLSDWTDPRLRSRLTCICRFLI